MYTLVFLLYFHSEEMGKFSIVIFIVPWLFVWEKFQDRTWRLIQVLEPRSFWWSSWIPLTPAPHISLLWPCSFTYERNKCRPWASFPETEGRSNWACPAVPTQAPLLLSLGRDPGYLDLSLDMQWTDKPLDSFQSFYYDKLKKKERQKNDELVCPSLRFNSLPAGGQFDVIPPWS